MHVLVANLGSTSFKYRLFVLDGEQARLLTRGGSERVTDYGAAIERALQELAASGHLPSPDILDAIGFKTVLGGDLTGCLLADERVEKALRDTADLAPAHNPPYAEGLRIFRERLPSVPRVALFETAFYQWVPDCARRYAVPEAWYKAGIRRYGFHGASHKFVAERSAELLGHDDLAALVRRLYLDGPRPVSGKPLRVISCHLGGSSSVTGILNGVAIGTSMGLSPQSGLPQNNRVGDLDSAALPCAMRRLGLTQAEAERQLVKESGLLGLSGRSNDFRDIETAANQGDARARLALDVYVHSIRQWIGRSGSSSAAAMHSCSPPALAKTMPGCARSLRRTGRPRSRPRSGAQRLRPARNRSRRQRFAHPRAGDSGQRRAGRRPRSRPPDLLPPPRLTPSPFPFTLTFPFPQPNLKPQP
jgi:acetate kinase